MTQRVTVLVAVLVAVTVASVAVVVRSSARAAASHGPVAVSDMVVVPVHHDSPSTSMAMGGGTLVASTPKSVILRTLPPSRAPGAAPPGAKDGLVTTLEITTDTFEIAKRYRSMEGPHADYALRVDGSLTADAGAHPRELWWWKGATIELFDEHDHPLGQEFMCHMNIDLDPKARDAEFPSTKTNLGRLLTLTQGEPRFELPAGWGVPVASDEVWNMVFQVLNHNRDGVFHVKQRLTLYFVRDADLFAPIDPLTWHGSFVWASVSKSDPDALAWDEQQCHCCSPLGPRTLEATNNVGVGHATDPQGRVIVGHWTVPPGKNTWSFPLARSAPEFAPKGERMFATWTHVHPFATEVRLVAHEPGCAPKVVARSAVESQQGGLIGLKRIDSPTFADGAPLPTGAAYELAVDYDNTSGRPQDSMTSFAFFVDDRAWRRPGWATRAQGTMDASCGLGPQ
jgi:hypothetical protein